MFKKKISFFKVKHNQKNEELTHWLLENNFKSFHKQNEIKITAFKAACEQKKEFICSLILNHNVNLIITDHNKNNYIHFAAKAGFINIIKTLIHLNIKTTKFTNNLNQSPLFFACISGNLTLCKLLYKYDGNGLQVDKTNTSLLMIACKHGHLNIAKWLYSVGAVENITTPNDFGDTLMHIACKNGDLNFVKWLLTISPKEHVYLINSENKTPCFIAYKQNHLHVVTHLIRHNSLKYNEQLYKQSICPKSNLSLLKLMKLNTHNIKQHHLFLDLMMHSKRSHLTNNKLSLLDKGEGISGVLKNIAEFADIYTSKEINYLTFFQKTIINNSATCIQKYGRRFIQEKKFKHLVDLNFQLLISDFI